jgi:hypothetical protein
MLAGWELVLDFISFDEVDVVVLDLVVIFHNSLFSCFDWLSLVSVG